MKDTAIDYHALCLSLFGTDDVEILKQYSEILQKKNPRHAGRKKKFSEEDVRQMLSLRANGMTLQQIAEQYGTSRQVVGRYLTKQPDENSTMRMIFMFRQFPCTVIDVDFLNHQIQVQNQTDDVLHRAFGVKADPSWQDFEQFLSERCFPESRGNKKQMLQELGLSSYDTLQIVEKTQGRLTDDDQWLKIRTMPRRSAA